MQGKIISEAEFKSALRRTAEATSQIPGHLTDSEGHILTLLAVCPTATGEIVEIGSYKGKSTVLLATALESTGEPTLHACDPFAAPGTPGQDLRTDDTTYEEFKLNLKVAGVTDRVVVHRKFSTDLAREWRAPIRLLWVDGDHSYGGAAADFDAWHKFVVPGGIIAFHDALHVFPGPPQVFTNRILLDDAWGACGFCGSIGWAQRVRSPEEANRFRDLKTRLYLKMSRLAASVALGSKIKGARKLWYKLFRAAVPHTRPTFTKFKQLTGY